jgi:hypothetical protein
LTPSLSFIQLDWTRLLDYLLQRRHKLCSFLSSLYPVLVARIKPGPAILGIHGTVGRKLTFVKRGRDFTVYELPTKEDAKSSLQLEQRGRFFGAVSAWHDLTEEERAGWAEMAAVRGDLTGYQLFLSEHLGGRLAPEEPPPPPPLEAVVRVSGGAADNVGVVAMWYTANDGPPAPIAIAAGELVGWELEHAVGENDLGTLTLRVYASDGVSEAFAVRSVVIAVEE